MQMAVTTTETTTKKTRKSSRGTPGPVPVEFPAPAEPPTQAEEPPPVETADPPEAEAAEVPTPDDDIQEELRVPTGRGHRKPPAAAFFQLLTEISDWSRAKVWLYRIEPISDRVAQGNRKYIRIWNEPLDEDAIMKDPECGSGVYQALLTIQSENGSWIPRAKLDRFEIENPTYPPKVPGDDWINDPRNKRWAWAKPKTTEQPAAQATGTGPSLSDTLAAMGQLIDAKLPKQQEQPRSETILDAVKTGIGLVPKQEGGSATDTLRDEMKQLRTELAEERRRNHEMLMEQLKAARTRPDPPPQKTLIEQIAEVKQVREVLDEDRRKGGDKDPWWVDVLTPFAQQLAPVAAIWLQHIATQPPPQPRQHPKPATIDVKPTVEAGQQQTTAEEPMHTQEQQQTKEPTVPPVLAQHALMALQWFSRGNSGTDYADWLVAAPTLGPQVILEFRAIPGGADGIVEIAKGVPQLWSLIAPVKDGEARFKQFIAEVLAWEPEGEDQP
jgi:hypothetical protein